MRIYLSCEDNAITGLRETKDCCPYRIVNDMANLLKKNAHNKAN